MPCFLAKCCRDIQFDLLVVSPPHNSPNTKAGKQAPPPSQNPPKPDYATTTRWMHRRQIRPRLLASHLYACLCPTKGPMIVVAASTSTSTSSGDGSRGRVMRTGVQWLVDDVTSMMPLMWMDPCRHVCIICRIFFTEKYIMFTCIYVNSWLVDFVSFIFKYLFWNFKIRK